MVAFQNRKKVTVVSPLKFRRWVKKKDCLWKSSMA